MTALDCRTCGACCVADWDDPTYVYITEDDLVKLTRKVRERHVQETRAFPRAEPTYALKTKRDPAGNVVCSCLRGTVGKRVSCSIYANRPGVCEKFMPGGRGCQFARNQAGLDGKPRQECA